MTGYERAVEYARKKNSYALLDSLMKERSSLDYNALVDLWEQADEDKKHTYPPVYDSLLKAWVNRPPHGRPGQGAKE
jgi:hypothetical protein